MASTGERMLELLALLQARHRWSGDELAERLGISERTVRRDVDRLRALGYPVHADRGTAGGYRLGQGTRLPPLLIGGDEAVAIAVGLRHAARQPIAGISDAAVRALTKIADILPADARHEIESVSSTITVSPPDGPAASTRSDVPDEANSDVDLDTLTGLARASRDSEVARFSYRSAAANDSERRVEPHNVVPVGWRWYLVAWDLDREDWRTFRLDRITDLHITKRRFDPRPLPADDAAAYVAQRLASFPAAHSVDVVVQAPLAEVQRHLGPWGTATNVDTNGVEETRIAMNVDDLSWVVLMLAAINAEIRHADPPELLALLHTLGQRFSGAAGPA